LQEVIDWRLVQLKLTQEQTETHSEIFGDLFETAFNEDMFWSSIITGGESWCLQDAPSQGQHDEAQILRGIGSPVKKVTFAQPPKERLLIAFLVCRLRKFFLRGKLLMNMCRSVFSIYA
jgi:hypothetical protein